MHVNPPLEGNIMKALMKWINRNYAPYLVGDTYGTCVYVWRWKEAMAWLPYCSPDAAIFDNRCPGHYCLTSRSY